MGATLAGVLMVAFAVAGLPHTSRSTGESSPQVRVILLNDSVVPVDLAERAQAEVTRLYKLIGVEVVWVAEPPPDEELHTIKVTTWEPREAQFSFALGMTPAQRGTRRTRAYVFWGRVQRYAHKHAAGFDSMLAVAIAHELGHMLLPAGSHAEGGLMSGSWDSNHFRSAAAGLLHFSPESARMIRHGLMPHVVAAANR